MGAAVLHNMMTQSHTHKHIHSSPLPSFVSLSAWSLPLSRAGDYIRTETPYEDRGVGGGSKSLPTTPGIRHLGGGWGDQPSFLCPLSAQTPSTPETRVS